MVGQVGRAVPGEPGIGQVQGVTAQQGRFALPVRVADVPKVTGDVPKVHQDSFDKCSGISVFTFPTADIPGRFQAGESLTYTVTATGLTPESFNTLSKKGGDHGPFVAEGKIQGWNDSSWLTAGAAPIPEPATYIAGGLLLIPLLVQLRRWKRAK